MGPRKIKRKELDDNDEMVLKVKVKPWSGETRVFIPSVVYPKHGITYLDPVKCFLILL